MNFGIRRENEKKRDGGCGVVFNPATQKFAVGKIDGDGLLILFSGGVDPSEDIKEGVLREITEESGLYDFLYIEKIEEVEAHYRNILKNVNRVSNTTSFLVVLNSTNQKPLKLEEHEKFSLVWRTSNEILSNWESRNEEKDYDHWIYFLKKGSARLKELGYLNS